MIKNKTKRQSDSEIICTLLAKDSKTHDPRSFTDGIHEGMYNLIVNKSGFPLDGNAWEEMWQHISEIHPNGKTIAEKIRGNAEKLPQISFVIPPSNLPVQSNVIDRLNRIQEYMLELQYNHTGTQFFEIKKGRSIAKLMNTAKQMVHESLPIKCLEAVILATYLTNNLPVVDRFPISFRTNFGGHFHRHVVLGICFNNRYATLGMSRRDDLMYKPLVYKNFSDLIMEFKGAYQHYMHHLNRLKIGLPIPHDSNSVELINWKYLTLEVSMLSNKDLIKELDHFAREIRRIKRGQLFTPFLKSNASKSQSKGFQPLHNEPPEGRKCKPKQCKQTNQVNYQVQV